MYKAVFWMVQSAPPMQVHYAAITEIHVCWMAVMDRSDIWRRKEEEKVCAFIEDSSTRFSCG